MSREKNMLKVLSKFNRILILFDYIHTIQFYSHLGKYFDGVNLGRKLISRSQTYFVMQQNMSVTKLISF